MKAITLFDLPWTIAQHVTVDEGSGCWRGTGLAHDRDGYARIGSRGAHRVVYELLVGKIPAGLQLDHVKARGCTHRDCLNVAAHMEPVTPRVNCLRGNSFAALNALKTHCGACGREYDLLNCYWSPDGRRDCRSCIARRSREYKAG